MKSHAWANTIVNICWIIFVVVWIAAAFSTKKTVFRQSLGQRLLWGAVTFAGALLLFMSSDIAGRQNVRFLPRTPSFETGAALLCICGLAITLWARATLGRNWSGRVTIKEDHELIERGPYRFVRHPIYSGLSLMILATAVLIGRIAALAGFLLIFGAFWIKLMQEERLLMGKFPAEYADYRKRTKRIIPLVL